MKVDPEELVKKIEAFNQLDFNTMSDQDIMDEIDKILKIEYYISIINSYSVYQKGARFYRVRRLSNLDIPNDALSIISDFWNPPPKYVNKYGRLNKPHESLLYTALNPLVAIKETHISKGDFFCIIIYEAHQDVQVSWIGSETNYKHHNIYNEKAILVHEIYKKFLIDEFAKEIPLGQETRYRVTEHIAKEYFVSPEQKGWRYPSVKDHNQYNICFMPEAIGSYLTLKGAMIGTYLDFNDFELEYIASGFDNDGNAIIYDTKDYNKLMNEMFAEFVPRRD